MLISDIAKVFDALGWYSPSVIKAKILLQRLWEEGIEWDDPAPPDIHEVWHRWKMELPCLINKPVSRCYYPKNTTVTSYELHGFSDASEDAYAAVVYLRMTDSNQQVHVCLVMSKTKVAPIKRKSIPRLELCGAVLLSKLLYRVKEVLRVSMADVVAWTDSTVVLSWLKANPRRFKVYVGNRVAEIIDRIPSNRWRHVPGVSNPADCASRGLYPSDLLQYQMWWEGPVWLKYPSSDWPSREADYNPNPSENDEVVSHAVTIREANIITVSHYSSIERLQRVVGWMYRFVSNCALPLSERTMQSYITVPELHLAKCYLYRMVQIDHFPEEIKRLKLKQPLPKGSCLLPLSPFMDSQDILRVGGRQRQSNIEYPRMHPVILHAKHHITRLIIMSEHKRLLHGGPTLVMASLSRRFHIIRARRTVRLITQQCIVCRRWSSKPKPPSQGQLPIERLTPGPVFDSTGLDYAGPLYIKYGHVRKPVIVKAYVCVFVSLTVKAVHLELVSDLSTSAFLACLRRFIARRGQPSMIWSDHGSNFVGANREIKEMFEFLGNQTVQQKVSEFCTARHIQWKFIPQHSPHFGGIWEACVKSFKRHLKRVVGDTKLTYEELYTVLTQIESCLNSRPLIYVDVPDEDGIEVLTPGHFLVGQPLMSLPDPSASYQSVNLIKRWNLCQHLVRNLWKRWSLEYLATLRQVYKWQYPTKNLSTGDIVLLMEDGLMPTKWPFARVMRTYPGKDGIVRVVDVKTPSGNYRRPVHKLAPLLDVDTQYHCVED